MMQLLYFFAWVVVIFGLAFLFFAIPIANLESKVWDKIFWLSPYSKDTQ